MKYGDKLPMVARSIFVRTALGFALFTASLTSVVPLDNAYARALPAQTAPLTLSAVKVEGNKAVSTEDILRAFGHQPGDHVTQDDLKASQQRVADLYSQRNIGGSLGEQMKIKGASVMVTLLIGEQSAHPAATGQQLVLDQVEFKGNTRIPTEALAAVTHLRPGGAVSDKSVVTDETAIQSAYKSKNLAVRIQPVATYPNHDHHVVLTWQIDENPSPAK